MPDDVYTIRRRKTQHRGLTELALRLRTRWKRGRLDEKLAQGADPASSAELKLRAAQLGSRAERSRLADSLVKTLDDARKPAPFTLRLQPHRAEIRACADDLLALALRLRDERPVEVRGMALAALLFTRGKSPLDPDSGASLREAVRSALAALGSPSGRRRPLAA